MFAFFVDRPILAGVISVVITVIGAVAGLTLPIAQFPEIAPPVINIQATYPGASAEQAHAAVDRQAHVAADHAQQRVLVRAQADRGQVAVGVERLEVQGRPVRHGAGPGSCGEGSHDTHPGRGGPVCQPV